MTPDEPESSGLPDAHEDHAKSRADLQAELRSSRKKERKRKHRWRRRTIYALSFVIVLAAAGVGGVYVYANYRFNQIKKIHAKHLVATPIAPGKPFNLLLVGSDSRSFVSNSTQVKAFGDEANAGGQRSDVTMVARFDPAAKTVTVLSIPRDLWVDIPGNDSGISGMNRINAAYDGGPDLLIQTIEKDLGIPINHYVAVNFPGFSGMVNALGGVTMDFPTPVKDQYTGLNVSTVGCQVVNGTTALELVRSRHMYYKNSNGYWEYDGLSDFSRIQRQDAFFRAVLSKINSSITNPLAINSFIGAAVGNLTIDDTLSQGDLLHIADVFRGLPTSHLVTETLPTVSYTSSGGAAALKVAEPYAQNVINAFNLIGTAPPPTTTTTAPTKGHKATTTTTTTVPTEAHGDVDVDVLNASTVSGIAHTTAAALTDQGFQVNEIGDASTQLATDGSSEILYGSSGTEAAHTLASVLSGPVTLVPDPSLSTSTVQLLLAGSGLSVTGSSSGGTTTTTTQPGPTTTTTIPSDVYANTQPEPWNPSPCILGQATSTTTTTKAAKKK
ncbi:MAG TPA: LCP family protein [Acidimicrobiales bacterium]|nr:LCP family protein [Acidimicrobiales bacterium]